MHQARTRITPPQPQLAKLARRPPSGSDWIHEIKYDGYRVLADVQDGDVRLYTRNGHDWTARLPGVARAVQELGLEDGCLDGEVVVFDDDGVPSFERLQRAVNPRKAVDSVQYAVWDLLRLGGDQTVSLPLLDRKKMLREHLETGPTLLYVDHIEDGGDLLFQRARELGLEGVVSKRGRAPYRPGDRGGDWLKSKCTESQIYAVAGYTAKAGHIRSLLLAHLDDSEQLVYIGRVSASLSSDRLKRLHSRLQAAAAPEPFITSPPAIRAQWVRFGLGARVRSLPWVPGRPLRHAVLEDLVG